MELLNVGMVGPIWSRREYSWISSNAKKLLFDPDSRSLGTPVKPRTICRLSSSHG
jgi:hypothetical protein